MDKELEEQINVLIEKLTGDFKSKLIKLVLKHESKIVKEHIKEFKQNNGSSSARKPCKRVVGDKGDKKVAKGKKNEKYQSESDGSDYYSE